MGKLAIALRAVKESTASVAEPLFRNVKAFVRSAALCVSGQAGLAVLAGISVRVVVSRGTGVRLPARDWKLAKMRREKKSISIQKVS